MNMEQINKLCDEAQDLSLLIEKYSKCGLYELSFRLPSEFMVIDLMLGRLRRVKEKIDRLEQVLEELKELKKFPTQPY